jgi:glycosyltransferase involved in cell wall biosynthesis
MTSLDIILPAYNPLPGWEETVIGRFQSLAKALPAFKITLFIVNDGSRTLDEPSSIGILRNAITDIQWISYKDNRGKGFALREGVKKASGDYILYTDIDWPYTEESMLGLINMLTEKADAVIGIRDEGYYDHLPLSRRRISRLLRKINANFLRLKVDDTQAGLKGFTSKVKPIFLATTINRYLFDLEFIYLLSSKKNNYTILGVPITLRSGITFSQMNRKILFQEARNFFTIWWKS